MNNKLEDLRNYFQQKDTVLVAFSGGVDSTFLLKVAHDVLKDRVAAVTLQSAVFPKREKNEAELFCTTNGIRQFVIQVDHTNIEGFSENPKNRCYICKKYLFSKIKEIAAQNSFSSICEGSNIDDLNDYRPGLKAIEELNIESPLRKCNLYKAEIRTYSEQLGLKVFSKPSFACLASRFTYGEKITAEKLLKVEQAEDFLISQGIAQVRVRVQQNTARIEVLPNDLSKILTNSTSINNRLKEIGFDFVSVDLGGYKTGNMNVGI